MAGILLLSPAQAQLTSVRQILLRPAVDSPAEGAEPGMAELEAAMTAAGLTVEGAAAAGAMSPEDQRLQQLLQLQFDRQPQELLQALSRHLDPASGGGTNEIERFRDDVVAGRWEQVGAFLEALPEAQRGQVYQHVLTGLLQEGGEGMAMPMMRAGRRIRGGVPMPGMMAGMMPGMGPGSVLLPDDVLALADLAPGELTSEWLGSLSQLLTRVLSKGHHLEPVLARLEKGTARLGGVDPARRAAAVRLLLGAGRLADAGTLLPALDQALADGDLAALDLHASYLQEVGSQGTNTTALQQSWELTQVLLTATNAPASTNQPAPAREAVLQRALELLPWLAGQQGTHWLQSTFRDQPARGMAILAAAVAPPPDFRSPEARQRALELQQQAVNVLLDTVGGDVAPWRTPLTVMALNWAQEAELTRTRWFDRAQFDPNQYGDFDLEEQMRMQQMNDPNQIPPLPPAEVLKRAPEPRWLALMDVTLAPHLEYLIGTLQLKTDDPQPALAQVEKLAPAQPKPAAELANELLRSWARLRNPNASPDAMSMPMRMRYGLYGQAWYGPGSPYGMGGQGIALTRAMQHRNLEELAGLVARLRRLALPGLEENAVIEAFTSAHSQAEVFRSEDLVRVFGEVGQMRLETLAGLLQTIRQRLATSWRQMRVQQDAKTRRTDKDLEAEVTRGYELFTDLIRQGLERWSEDWRLHLVQAVGWFDFAEFQYGHQVDLALYVEKREQSFAGFARAAELYAAGLPALEPGKYSPDLFVSWFNANLGASDLAYVTRQQEPSTNHLARLRATILALPGGAGPRHLELFTAALTASLDSIKPDLKPRYVRAALRVCGDQPASADLRQVARYYDDLLGEIGLDVRLDGDALVGHGAPFGVFVTLRHTAAVERESGGFARYLQNQNQPYYNQGGGQQRNARDDFEKQLREKLGDTFEIQVITFAGDKGSSRGIGREGWRETPLAYVLLKAKDGAVDRLPSFHFDLDFFDRRGQVVLPVESSIVLLDARPARAAPRPVREVAVTQILDDRELAGGRLTLDIRATGRGVLPGVEELLDTAMAGFSITQTNDSGVAIGKLDTEGDDLAAVSERSWVLELKPESDDRGPATFRFPTAKSKDMAVTFKRYADADLVEVKPELALAGVRLRPDRTWRWVMLGVVAVAAVAVLLIRRNRSATVATAEAAVYAMPAVVTPFSALHLLRRMQDDPRLPLSSGQREELGGNIRALENDFFSQGAKGTPKPDLEPILNRWLATAPEPRPTPAPESVMN